MVFPETTSLAFWVAAALMGLGVWLHLTEHHAHEHLHETLQHEHEHEHEHDEHHQHVHDFEWDGVEPDSRSNKKELTVMVSSLFSDVHQRHSHS
jgi:ABC-type Zn2+ transport system substrate-binding protein/surface adhesin